MKWERPGLVVYRATSEVGETGAGCTQGYVESPPADTLSTIRELRFNQI